MNGDNKTSFNINSTISNSVEILKCGMDKLSIGENSMDVTASTKQPFGYSSEILFRSRKFSTQKHNNGLDISREYFLIKIHPDGTLKEVSLTKSTKVVQGDIIKVKIRVNSKVEGSKYLMLKDFIPAGCEVIKDINSVGKNKKQSYTRMEYRDASVIFFLTDVPNNGVTFSYSLRAETAGQFSANPADAELMYNPTIFGHSDSAKLIINKNK